MTRELTQETTCPLSSMKIGEINSKLNDIIFGIVEDELDAEILCDELLSNLEDILDNYEKSLDDPEYDVDPMYNEYNSTQNQIIEDNKIPVIVLDEDNNEITKFIDKRILEGTIEL